MTARVKGLLAGLAVLAVLGALVWKAELFTVQRSDATPAPLVLIPAAERAEAKFDASLPMVPVGVRTLMPGQRVLVVEYWAPWMRHSGPQALALDSLRRSLPPGAIEVALVCFDPFPSVSRYVARMRLRLPVLLDLRKDLAAGLPCPSIPYTYVIDREGRIAAKQAGEVDWLSLATRAVLDSLGAEPSPTVPLKDAAAPKPVVL
ncbi:MAG: TlpA family protein disulfide reductase [Candidatus Eisenbacteria bacterium]|uniref:TlpA family protein disulfide reductase n=1 Tax=Eiseniibacteriota bacterium TaxID=2212470 RepID=A0A933WB50_UNCEI|nr:TlpA family protein disulfide reductase [Candidatus Eisenbacteria bacterium]